jgi:hypothetical protein
MRAPIVSLGSVLILIVLGFSLMAKERDATKLPPPADKQGVTYAQDIKPLLDRACLDCHGPQKTKAKLRLDSLQGILKGGADGKVVEPGQSGRSLLVYAVARSQAEAMPPKGKGAALSKEQVALIRAWIDQGAK